MSLAEKATIYSLVLKHNITTLLKCKVCFVEEVLNGLYSRCVILFELINAPHTSKLCLLVPHVNLSGSPGDTYHRGEGNGNTSCCMGSN